MTPRQTIGLVVLAAIWGASFIFVDVAVPALGAVGLADSRSVIGAAALIVYGLVVRHALRSGAPRRTYFVVGAVNVAIPFVLIAAAQLTIPPSLAAIINATAPLFSAVIAGVWLGHRLSPQAIAGLAVGLLGVALVVGGAPIALDVTTLLAVAASTGAAACYALGGHLTKDRFPTDSPLVMAAGQQLAAGILLTPFLVADPPNATPDAGQVAAALALGVGSSGVAYLIYFRLIEEVGATSALTVTYLVPVFGVLWAALFRGDEITAGMLVGAAVVLAGVALVTGASSPGSGGPSDPVPPSPNGASPPPPAPTGARAGRS
ncbi:MAG TPA: DMT family transporter [Solirubrobacteraceae bacterium]|nr:DMT family transporter [Solirubrobacteraceae bacterium]